MPASSLVSRFASSRPVAPTRGSTIFSKSSPLDVIRTSTFRGLCNGVWHRAAQQNQTEEKNESSRTHGIAQVYLCNHRDNVYAEFGESTLGEPDIVVGL